MKLPSIFIKHPKAYWQEPGAVDMIPDWVFVFIVLLSFSIVNPNFFQNDEIRLTAQLPLTPLLFVSLFGTLLPVFDDLLTFLFGPPFSHHSFFHSLPGVFFVSLIAFSIFPMPIAIYLFYGHLFHIGFNFFLDYIPLFFPWTNVQYGFTQLVHISTYWLRAGVYPCILLFFLIALVRFFLLV